MTAPENFRGLPSESAARAIVRSASENDHLAFVLLAELLSRAHVRADTQALAQLLEDRFHTAYALFTADALLLESCGIPPREALLISRFAEMNRYLAVKEANKPKIATLEAASAYLTQAMFLLRVEEFHMLCVDGYGRLSRHIVLERGTEDTALFSLHDAMIHVMRYKPKAIVLAHNHPSRTLRPSQEDLDCTLRMLRVLRPIGIPMLDHLIIVDRHAVSIRDNCFIPAEEWIRQEPRSHLLRNWLSGETKKR